MQRLCLVSTLAGVCLSLLLCIAPARAADIPSITDADLEQALQLAGSNRGELEAALFSCLQKPYTMAAMRFMVASLPVVDMGSISAAQLEEHVELALQARGEFAWGAGYDDAVWAHYVLPPRVSQEPLSAWRPYFYAQLRELVASCRTLDEAAVKVNYWCGERVRFQQTQRRDQGPLATLKSGYGRCEEMVIFYIAACRAVGIPARQAYCPYWAVSDNNHAWTEVLGADGRWHYVGACEPAPTLDSAWYGGAVKQAPLVVSVCFGLPDYTELRWGKLWVNDSGEPILVQKPEPGARYCLLNSTSNYRATSLVTVEEPAEPAPAADPRWLYVHVFNYGALRQIARIPFIAGAASLELGPGDYVFSCENAFGPGSVLKHVDPGVELAFAWDDQIEAPAEMLLQFPADP